MKKCVLVVISIIVISIIAVAGLLFPEFVLYDAVGLSSAERQCIQKGAETLMNNPIEAGLARLGKFVVERSEDGTLVGVQTTWWGIELSRFGVICTGAQEPLHGFRLR